MDADLSALPDDIETLKAALLAARAEAAAVGAELAHARVATNEDHSLIAHLKLEIEKLRQDIYGAGSERSGQLLDQLEPQLAEAEADPTVDELTNAFITRNVPRGALWRRHARNSWRALR